MDIHEIDLQIQTSTSDGKLTPAECVGLAKKNGLHTIAITDHDTVAGVEEAEAEGEKLGVKVIPGIEISAEDHGVHILGFGVGIHHEPLLKMLAEFAEGRRNRAREMVERFATDGFSITWDDVMAESHGAVVGRPHIVDAILKRPENKKRLGGITNRGEFFKQFFGNSSKYYVRHAGISARDTIQLIHDAGGVAVWSHPPVPDFSGKYRELEEFLEELIGWGLDGVEALGPSLTAGDAKCLDRLAAQYQLLRTAGSDFHEVSDQGTKPWPRSASTIGEYPAYSFSTNGILEALDLAIQRRHNSSEH